MLKKFFQFGKNWQKSALWCEKRVVFESSEAPLSAIPEKNISEPKFLKVGEDSPGNESKLPKVGETTFRQIEKQGTWYMFKGMETGGSVDLARKNLGLSESQVRELLKQRVQKEVITGIGVHDRELQETPEFTIESILAQFTLTDKGVAFLVSKMTKEAQGKNNIRKSFLCNTENYDQSSEFYKDVKALYGALNDVSYDSAAKKEIEEIEAVNKALGVGFFERDRVRPTDQPNIVQVKVKVGEKEEWVTGALADDKQSIIVNVRTTAAETAIDPLKIDKNWKKPSNIHLANGIAYTESAWKEKQAVDTAISENGKEFANLNTQQKAETLATLLADFDGIKGVSNAGLVREIAWGFDKPLTGADLGEYAPTRLATSDYGKMSALGRMAAEKGINEIDYKNALVKYFSDENSISTLLKKLYVGTPGTTSAWDPTKPLEGIEFTKKDGTPGKSQELLLEMFIDGRFTRQARGETLANNLKNNLDASATASAVATTEEIKTVVGTENVKITSDDFAKPDFPQTLDTKIVALRDKTDAPKNLDAVQSELLRRYFTAQDIIKQFNIEKDGQGVVYKAFLEASDPAKVVLYFQKPGDPGVERGPLTYIVNGNIASGGGLQFFSVGAETASGVNRAPDDQEQLIAYTGFAMNFGPAAATALTAQAGVETKLTSSLAWRSIVGAGADVKNPANSGLSWENRLVYTGDKDSAYLGYTNKLYSGASLHLLTVGWTVDVAKKLKEETTTALKKWTDKNNFTGIESSLGDPAKIKGALEAVKDKLTDKVDFLPKDPDARAAKLLELYLAKRGEFLYKFYNGEKQEDIEGITQVGFEGASLSAGVLQGLGAAITVFGGNIDLFLTSVVVDLEGDNDSHAEQMQKKVVHTAKALSEVGAGAYLADSTEFKALQAKKYSKEAVQALMNKFDNSNDKDEHIRSAISTLLSNDSTNTTKFDATNTVEKAAQEIAAALETAKQEELKATFETFGLTPDVEKNGTNFVITFSVPPAWGTGETIILSDLDSKDFKLETDKGKIKITVPENLDFPLETLRVNHDSFGSGIDKAWLVFSNAPIGNPDYIIPTQKIIVHEKNGQQSLQTIQKPTHPDEAWAKKQREAYGVKYDGNNKIINLANTLTLARVVKEWTVAPKNESIEIVHPDVNTFIGKLPTLDDSGNNYHQYDAKKIKQALRDGTNPLAHEHFVGNNNGGEIRLKIGETVKSLTEWWDNGLNPYEKDAIRFFAQSVAVQGLKKGQNYEQVARSYATGKIGKTLDGDAKATALSTTYTGLKTDAPKDFNKTKTIDKPSLVRMASSTGLKGDSPFVLSTRSSADQKIGLKGYAEKNNPADWLTAVGDTELNEQVNFLSEKIKNIPDLRALTIDPNALASFKNAVIKKTPFVIGTLNDKAVTVDFNLNPVITYGFVEKFNDFDACANPALIAELPQFTKINFELETITPTTTPVKVKQATGVTVETGAQFSVTAGKQIETISIGLFGSWQEKEKALAGEEECPPSNTGSDSGNSVNPDPASVTSGPAGIPNTTPFPNSNSI